MTSPMLGQLTLADRVEAEHAQVTQGTATGCGYIDPGCRGGLTCIRGQHDETTAHVGRDATGQLVQWMPPCPAPAPAGV